MKNLYTPTISQLMKHHQAEQFEGTPIQNQNQDILNFSFHKSLLVTLVCMLLLCLNPLSVKAQSYEKLWKEVETLQQKDLPRSVLQKVNVIYEKARSEKNVSQLLRAQLMRASEQVHLTPDSTEVEVARLKAWAESETDSVTAALLYHLLGNISMQQSPSNWKEAMANYQRSIQPKALLLKTSAGVFAPITETTPFSERFFQNNLYDLLVRQAISGMMANWKWRQEIEIQDWIVDLYDSLITSYTTNGNRTAAMLSHEAKILFLSKQGVADSYGLSAEQAEKALRDLLRLYESQLSSGTSVAMDAGKQGEVVNVDALVDVHMKLAETLCEQQRFAEAMEVLRSAQKKYPKTSLDNELRRKMEWILHPALSMDIPLVYPLYKGSLVVSYKNITEVKIETYRLRLVASDPELYGNLTKETLCESYGQKIATQTFRLPDTTDYQLHVENLTYQLPAKGIYVVKATPVGRKGEASYQLLFVSPYQCLTIPVSDEEVEVIAVDRLTGNPIPYAELVEYQLNPSQGGNSIGFPSPKKWRTNQKGSIILKNSGKETKYINVRTAGNDFMKITPLYARGNYRKNEYETSWQPLTVLFTDRALYRPGQLVHVSGIRYEQQGDSMRTSVSKLMNVQLIDSNGKQVSEQKATTDAFGVFSVDFTLPQRVLPGYFTLRTENKALSIRVENYKRPTFDVTFTPVHQTYTFGDALSVSGTAKTFAGAPVRLAKGNYRIVRSEAWLWRGTGNEKEISTGAFSTDASGQFSIDFSLLPPPTVKRGYGVPYYIYKVKVDVTSGAGETQASELSLPVGKESIGLQIKGLQPKMARERQAKMQFQVMNLNKQLVQTEVTYQVFALDETASPRKDKSIYARGNNQPKESVGKLVLERKAAAQQSFVPTAIYALPTGKYQLTVSARDEQGRLVSTTEDFILFSLADERPPVKTTEWFYQDGTSLADGKTVSLYVGSSEPCTYVLMDVFRADRRVRSERFYLNNSIRKFDFRYDESYGDGLIVSFAFLRDGRLHAKQVRLVRPKPEKDLMLKWESFRNQLTPGQQETWRMKITDCSGNPVNANLLAALYDASLDKLQTHTWWYQPYFNRFLPYVGIRVLSQATRGQFYIGFPTVSNEYGYVLLSGATYSRMLPFFIGSPYYNQRMNRVAGVPVLVGKSAGRIYHDAGVRRNSVDVEETDVAFEEAQTDVEIVYADNESSDERAEGEGTPANFRPLRTNFSETAFYYPMLRTDENGEVSISFTLPDAVTEWKFMGFAHTQGMDYGQLTGRVTASKPFMVQPNLPRFVRVGDKSSLAVSLMNLSMEAVEGQMRMELINPMTDQVVFTQKQNFEVAEGETGIAQFNYKVLDDYDVLICRVVAEAGEFSDGEQHYLPVLSNKERITETIPFQVNGNDHIDLSLKKLFNAQSRTATDKRLTIELTANPNWYVIQALPVVSNPTGEDAISWATAYYANALAVNIVKNNPHIQQVFQTWLNEGEHKAGGKGVSLETLWSNLEKNADLKNLLLEETPWLAEAQTETEQKRRVALLFELNGMEQRLQSAAQQLKTLQTSEGGWTWYPGMPVNRYTTTQIVEWMARLRAMNVPMGAVMLESYRRGLYYLKDEVKKEYARMQKDKTILSVSDQTITYLYICAIEEQANRSADKKLNASLVNWLLNGTDSGKKDKYSIYGKSYTIVDKARMAIIMHAHGQTTVASTLLQSVKEYLVSTPEMGSYFDTYKAAYTWNSYRIPTHVAAMEAIQRIQPDEVLLNGMKHWLLKQKQVQVWDTPIATVDAIYAFLLTDNQTVQTSGKLMARVGGVEITTPHDALGYTRITLAGNEVEQDNLHVQKEEKGIGWGAVYAQYSEQESLVKAVSVKGLSVEREYWLGNKKLDGNIALHVGDKLTIRLIIKNNRDMDFVCLKSQHAACMEPIKQLSGYQMETGVAAYRVNRDASTDYFFDRLPKGEHIVEYAVYLNRPGQYQTGTASIQSVYDPALSSHTGGYLFNVD